jgi:hypothetical protein
MSAAFWNGILRDHAEAHTIADRVTKAVTSGVYTNDHCIFAYCPNPESCKPDGCAHPRPLTPEEHALIDNAWERHKAAGPPEEYRGWAISWDYGCYTATSPDYDASWEGEEDGWVDNGLRTSARTLSDIYAEVDAILAEQAAS